MEFTAAVKGLLDSVRTGVPGAFTLANAYFVLVMSPGTSDVVSGWIDSVLERFRDEWGAVLVAMLCAAFLVGRVQSTIFFVYLWERRSLRFDLVALAMDASVPGRRSFDDNSHAWAHFSHMWHRHAECLNGFASLDARLTSLTDHLHGFGSMLVGALLTLVAAVTIATPSPWLRIALVTALLIVLCVSTSSAGSVVVGNVAPFGEDSSGGVECAVALFVGITLGVAIAGAITASSVELWSAWGVPIMYSLAWVVVVTKASAVLRVRLSRFVRDNMELIARHDAVCTSTIREGVNTARFAVNLRVGE